MTVRFTYRKNRIRIIGAGYWRKGKDIYERENKIYDEPIGKVRVISDFFPSPQELALKDETVKVTILLSKASVDFFKEEAKKYNTQYQKMIRRLLYEYAAHQS
jgi:predicted DNA binding CopG/RHH family protein